MMNNEKAIAELEDRLNLINTDYPQVKEYAEALKLAIKTLKREVPMSTEFYGMRYGGKAIGGKCPICGSFANSKDYNYCKCCGQKLEFSKF